MLPDRSILIEQKLVENARIEKLKCDFFSTFQTICERSDLCLHFELTKVDQKCQKKVHFDDFLKTRDDKPLPGKNQVV